jgi:hypothetical protein
MRVRRKAARKKGQRCDGKKSEKFWPTALLRLSSETFRREKLFFIFCFFIICQLFHIILGC